MKHIDIPPPQSSQAIHLLAASGGRRAYRQTNRECAGLCACGSGCFFVPISVVFLIYGPTAIDIAVPGFDIFFVIISIILFAGGIIVFPKTVQEKRRIVKAIEGRDEVSLDTISTEANVPYERTKEYLTNFIKAGFLKGQIVDDMYIASLKAERIDSRTIRCPHCDTELELPDED